MDWSAVISRNHAILVRIVAELFAMLHGAGVPASGLPLKGGVKINRTLFHAILAVLRPAESAVRRLIAIAAHGLKIKPRAFRPFPAGGIAPSATHGARTPTFNLIDPLRKLAPEDRATESGLVSSLTFMDHQVPLIQPQIQISETSINAAMLLNRLRAVRRALDHLPRQARRLARWRAQHTLQTPAHARAMRLSPFRPGPPPGTRKRPIHEIDRVLSDVHHFAREAWWDTS